MSLHLRTYHPLGGLLSCPSSRRGYTIAIVFVGASLSFVDFIFDLDRHLLRGRVNNFFLQNSKKTLERGGWVKCPIGYKKNWKIYFYALFPLVLTSIRMSITL